MANCLSCKTPQMNALISSGEEGVYSLPFDDVLELCEEPVGCYTCHENTGNELVVTNTFLTDALGEDAADVAPANQVCGQCHNEYYFDPQTKATTLPYTSLETMTPDAILAYYNEIGFSDYTDPQTGVGSSRSSIPSSRPSWARASRWWAMTAPTATWAPPWRRTVPSTPTTTSPAP